MNESALRYGGRRPASLMAQRRGVSASNSTHAFTADREAALRDIIDRGLGHLTDAPVETRAMKIPMVPAHACFALSGPAQAQQPALPTAPDATQPPAAQAPPSGRRALAEGTALYKQWHFDKAAALVKHLTAKKDKRCGRVADGRPVVREAGCQMSDKMGDLTSDSAASARSGCWAVP
jgi:hypothetical protein